MENFGLHERYVNFYTDFAFKKLFGTEANKELLISFLNALLQGCEEIKDITYLKAENLPDSARERRAVFDVYCETPDGDKFLIEMQKAEQQFFKDRSVYYSTFPIREQAKRGDWNYELKRVYTIGILNFTFDDQNSNQVVSYHKISNTETKEVFFDKLTYIYLEMPKFRKTESELTTFFDKWLYVIKNLDRLMERPVALQEKVFGKLFEQAEIANFNQSELRDYEESLKIYRDWFSVMQTQHLKGENEGFAKGIIEGRIEGRAEGRIEGEKIGIEKAKLETAKSMKKDGLPINTIAKYTGLPIEEIENL